MKAISSDLREAQQVSQRRIVVLLSAWVDLRVAELAIHSTCKYLRVAQPAMQSAGLQSTRIDLCVAQLVLQSTFTDLRAVPLAIQSACIDLRVAELASRAPASTCVKNNLALAGRTCLALTKLTHAAGTGS